MNLGEVLAPTRARSVQWSVSIRRDGEPAAFAEYAPRALLRTASVAKVFLLLEVAELLAAGALEPGRLMDRRSTHRVHDSGVWHAMHVDALPVADLALLVGAVSDNWATNVLLDHCGLDRVRARAAAWAPGGSVLHDYVRDERSGDVPETLSHGCAQDWAAIMQRLHTGTGVAPRVRNHVLAWLAHDADLSQVASAFDLDPLAHDAQDLGLRLWHKTGTDAGVRADVGTVRGPAAAVSYAVVANWPDGAAEAGTRGAVLSTMRRIGEQIRSVVAP